MVFVILDLNSNDDFVEDNLRPERILLLNDESINLTAFLVIDNTIFGIPSGGVRLAPDITLNEVVRLARAMTLKCAIYNIPSGGAKAGIKGDPYSQNKDLLITSFADMISPYIKDDIYYPGTDMGTVYSDLEKIFRVAKVKQWLNENIKLERNGHTILDHFTGYGVIFCLDTLYKKLKSFRTSNEIPKVILEGFGKVGNSEALCLKELGYKLLGLSTIKGAIFDEDGLDIDELLKLRIQYGDELVNRYNSRNLVKVEKEKLYELSSEYSLDFIIPGARPDAINKGNIDKIEAKAVIPAANIPYANGMIELLEEKGIIAFPDFVSNAGASVVLTMVNNQWTSERLFLFMKEKLVKMTHEILNGAHNNRSYVYKYARSKAINEIKNGLLKRKRKIERINKKYIII
ncbi:MAG: Glu/Leu/Phe/Val dehydrogenase dimerization domain-containing protein [Promethearchaeota archaeon]